jgi:hypothetical protein
MILFNKDTKPFLISQVIHEGLGGHLKLSWRADELMSS